MIKIENVDVSGWEYAIRGMRNPKNSWDRMDSYWCDTHITDPKACDECPRYNGPGLYCEALYKVGPNDHKLMMSLAKGGPVHAKYRRMIVVYMDITAPLYWWKEFDTYKVGTVANSCSTMHKIHAEEFLPEHFSFEHLSWNSIAILDQVIDELNFNRDIFLEIESKLKTEEYTEEERTKLVAQKKEYWWQMIQLLPSSYNQKRTVMLNYEVLNNIYHSRKDHKLDEWHTLCDEIRKLPYSEIITGEVKESED